MSHVANRFDSSNNIPYVPLSRQGDNIALDEVTSVALTIMSRIQDETPSEDTLVNERSVTTITQDDRGREAVLNAILGVCICLVELTSFGILFFGGLGHAKQN